jgi:hypothetical protein
MGPHVEKEGASEEERRGDEHRPDEAPRKPEKHPGHPVKPPRPFGGR